VQVAEAVDGFNDFLPVVPGIVSDDVANAGADLIFKVNRGIRNFVADEIEDHGLGLAFAGHADLDVRPFGPFQGLATTSEVMPSALLLSIAAITLAGIECRP